MGAGIATLCEGGAIPANQTKETHRDLGTIVLRFIVSLACIKRGVTELEYSKELLFNNIKALCDKEGISFYMLEKKLSLGRHTLTNCGKSFISWDKLAAVSDYFGVSVDYLIGKTNNPFSYKNQIRPAVKILIEAAEEMEVSEETALMTVRLMQVVDGFEN